MRRLIVLTAALALGQVAVAHELDKEAAASQDQIEHAKDLPGTLVLQINEKDPSKVQVFHLKEKIAPGTKLTGRQLERLAVKAEERVADAGDPKNELDHESSTSSWGFWFGSPFVRAAFRPWGGWGGSWGGYGNAGYGGGCGGCGGYGGYGGYGYGYQPQYYGGYSYYPANYSYVGCQIASPCGGYSNPGYSYGGYNYDYTPYYGYSTPAYWGVPSYRYVYYNYNPCMC